MEQRSQDAAARLPQARGRTTRGQERGTGGVHDGRWPMHAQARTAAFPAMPRDATAVAGMYGGGGGGGAVPAMHAHGSVLPGQQHAVTCAPVNVAGAMQQTMQQHAHGYPPGMTFPGAPGMARTLPAVAGIVVPATYPASSVATYPVATSNTASSSQGFYRDDRRHDHHGVAPHGIAHHHVATVPYTSVLRPVPACSPSQQWSVEAAGAPTTHHPPMSPTSSSSTSSAESEHQHGSGVSNVCRDVRRGRASSGTSVAARLTSFAQGPVAPAMMPSAPRHRPVPAAKRATPPVTRPSTDSASAGSAHADDAVPQGKARAGIGKRSIITSLVARSERVSVDDQGRRAPPACLVCDEPRHELHLEGGALCRACLVFVVVYGCLPGPQDLALRLQQRNQGRFCPHCCQSNLTFKVRMCQTCFTFYRAKGRAPSISEAWMTLCRRGYVVYVCNNCGDRSPFSKFFAYPPAFRHYCWMCWRFGEVGPSVMPTHQELVARRRKIVLDPPPIQCIRCTSLRSRLFYHRSPLDTRAGPICHRCYIFERNHRRIRTPEELRNMQLDDLSLERARTAFRCDVCNSLLGSVSYSYAEGEVGLVVCKSCHRRGARRPPKPSLSLLPPSSSSSSAPSASAVTSALIPGFSSRAPAAGGHRTARVDQHAALPMQQRREQQQQPQQLQVQLLQQQQPIDPKRERQVVQEMPNAMPKTAFVLTATSPLPSSSGCWWLRPAPPPHYPLGPDHKLVQ